MAVYTTINDPSAHFQTALYTGNGTSTNAVTNTGNSNLQPDWLWIKSRSLSSDHIIFDSTRGTNKRLSSNTTGAEETQAYYSSFDTDGFTIGSDNANVNQNSATYVNWQWKANGGTTATNSNGTITSTVQANTTAGFSIISYTGNGTDGATIGHGLNETPQIFFPKCLSTATNWEMYYFPTGETKQYAYLNLNNQFSTWSYTAPTSTTIGLSGSGDSNGNGRTMIGYAFHSVQGYSKIGTYIGNGSTDGPFIYTGFKPAYFLVKGMDITQNWQLWDNKRNDYPGNPRQEILSPSSTSTESGNYNVDFLSNGVKIRDTDGAWNSSGNNYLYMSFAESPFVTSDSVPTTAR